MGTRLKIIIVIGIVITALFIFNKSEVDESPEEVVRGFTDALIKSEGEKVTITMRNYFDSVGIKSHTEIYDAAKEARDVSLLAADSLDKVKIKNNLPDEIIQEMEKVQDEIVTSYELLANAFNYAMKYYGEGLQKNDALLFRENYDKGIELHGEAKEGLVVLEFMANSLVKVIEDENIDVSETENQSKDTNNVEKSKVEMGDISKLSLMDYAEKVNELSMEKVEYTMLHRPFYQEVDSIDSYSFSVITPESIVIATDKNSFIKEITWDSEEGLHEEILFNIQWLLLSLGDNISYKEVNEFIFHETITKQEFADFLVEFNKRENGFSLSLVARK